MFSDRWKDKGSQLNGSRHSKCVPILICSEIQFTLYKAVNLLSYRFSGFCVNSEKYKQVGSSGNTSDLIQEVYMYSLSCDTTYPDRFFISLVPPGKWWDNILNDDTLTSSDNFSCLFFTVVQPHDTV